MKKIISVFQRNYDGDRLIRDEVTPGAEWVLSGEGVATRKVDGTCCLVKDGVLYKRYDAKAFTIGNDGQKQPYNRKPPANFMAAQEPDELTGHWPGWVPVGDAPEDRWHREAWQNAGTLSNGTYELVGPKIQANAEHYATHTLVRHGAEVLDDCPRDFDGIREYLRHRCIEGVVFWRVPGDDNCDKAKVKVRDFGLKRETN